MIKSKRILILTVILLILAGGYFYLDKNLDSAETVTKGEDTRIELLNLDINKINDIRLSSNNENISLAKVDGKWFLKSDPSIFVDSKTVNIIAAVIAELGAERIVEENPENLAIYGLKNPAVKVEAALDDGTKKVIYIGDKTVDDKNYYIMLEGDKKVYISQKFNIKYLNYGLSQLRDKSLPYIQRDSMSTIKIIKGKNKIQLEKKAQWFINEPYTSTQMASGYEIKKLMESILNIEINEFVDDDPVDLSKYGLEKANMEIILEDTMGNTIHLYFGDEHEEEVYFKIEKSNTVYSLKKKKFEYFNNIKAFDLCDKAVFRPSIEEVDKVIIESSERKDILSIERTVNAHKDNSVPKSGEVTNETEKSQNSNAASTEEKDNHELLTFKINSKTIEKQDFTNLYNKLTSLTVEAENNKELENKADINITFILNEGKKEKINISFVTYDRDFYGVYKNDTAEFLISKEQVQGVLEALDSLKQ